MPHSGEYENKVKALREKAEKHLERFSQPDTTFTREEVEKLVHELSVHQIELQVQFDELLQTQQSLSELFENAPVGLVQLDENLIIRRTNNRFAEILGCPSDDIIITPFSRLIAPESTKAFNSYISQLKNRTPCPNQQLLLLPTPETRLYVELEGHMEKSKEGESASYQIAVIDIDSRIRAEQAQKQSEQRLQRVVDATIDVIWEWEPKEDRVFLSPGWFALTGSPVDQPEITYETWVASIHSDDKLMFERELGRCAYRKDVDLFRLEFRITNHNGETRWLFGRGKVIERTSDGTATLISGSISDVTEQRQAEERLRASQLIFRNFIEHTPIGVCITRPDYTFEYINPAYCEIYGYTEQDLLGKPFTIVVPKENRKMLQELHDKFFENSEDVRGEWSVIRKDGKQLHILADAALTQSIDGQPRKATFVIDITERKQMEKMLIHSERMAAVGTLAAGVAHEYNNAMAGVTGYLGLLLDNAELDEKTRARLQKMDGAANRIINVTRNLLTFSREESVGMRYCSVAAIVRESIQLVEEELRSDIIDLQLTLDESTKACCVRNEISQVLLNLLINARHALLGRQEKRIEISVGSVGVRAFVRVRDTGCGITPEDLENIKLPFYSRKGEFAEGDTPQSWVRGTGLGLSVSERIVQNHNGELQIESRAGEGTTVTVWLPSEESAAKEIWHAPPQSAEMVPMKRKHAGSGKSILLIEDEAIVRDPICEALNNEGFKAKSTDDGAAALKMIADTGFDLVIVDLLMPKMSGDEFLHELCDFPAETRPPCIIMTGRLDNESIADLPDDLVVDILNKPCRLRQILTSVKKALALR